MKAPNGKKTNLSEKLWLQVRTPNFKKWFGDWENDPEHASKVVDENGEPLVVYHGTPKGGFSVFDTRGEGMSENTGAWFTSKFRNAQSYQEYGDDESLYSVFLNIRNPYVIEGNGRAWNKLGEIYIIDEETGEVVYEKDNGEPFSSARDAENYIFDKVDDGTFEVDEDASPYSSGDPYATDDLIYGKYRVEVNDEFSHTNDIVRGVFNGELADGEFDGVIFKNIYDTGPYVMGELLSDVFVTPNSNAIKSATGNNGNFNANDPDIYHQTVQANEIFNDLSQKQQDNFIFLREAQNNLAQNEFNKLLNDTLTTGFRKKFQTWSNLPNNAEFGNESISSSQRKSFERTLRKDGFMRQRQLEKFNQLVTHATGNIIWGNQFDLAYVGSGEGFSDFGHGAYFSQNPEIVEKFRNSGKNKQVNQFRNEIIDRVNNDLDNGVKLNEALDDIRQDTKLKIKDLQREIKALFSEFSQDDNSPVRRSKSTLKSKLIKAVKKLNALQSGLSLINSISTLEDFKKLQKKNGNLYQFDIPEDSKLLDWDLPLFQQSRQVQEKLKTMLNALAQMGFSGSNVYKKAFFSQLGGIDITQGRAGNITGGMLYQNIMDFMKQEILKTLSPEQAREAFINHDKNIIPEAKIRTSQIFNEFGIPGHKFLDKSKTGSHNYVIWNTDKIKMNGIDQSSDSEAIKAFNNGGRKSENESYNQQVLEADEQHLTPEARAQMEDVRKRYQGTNQWLKAPNGKKSNLSERQWLQVRTPNFKRWFGDWENHPETASKILDSNGEPLIVYHGTNVPDINIFKRSEKGWLGPGMYFTPYKLYAKDYLRGKPGVIMALFMNMRNPLFVKTTNPVIELLAQLYGDKAEAIFNERYAKMRERMFSDFTKQLREGKIQSEIEQNFDRVIKQRRRITENSGTRKL